MDQFLYLPCMVQICSTTCDRRVNARLPQPLCLPLALRITSVPLFGLAAASVRFEDRAFKSTRGEPEYSEGTVPLVKLSAYIHSNDCASYLFGTVIRSTISSAVASLPDLDVK